MAAAGPCLVTAINLPCTHVPKMPIQGLLLMRAEEALATTEGLNWRKTPSEVGIGGRYPVKEVFAAAQATWKGKASLP